MRGMMKVLVLAIALLQLTVTHAVAVDQPSLDPLELAKLLVSEPVTGEDSTAVQAEAVSSGHDTGFIDNLMRFTESQQKAAAIAASVPGSHVDEVGQALAREHAAKIKDVIKEEHEREVAELRDRLIHEQAKAGMNDDSVLQAFQASLFEVGASAHSPTSASDSSSSSASKKSNQSNDDSSSSNHHHENSNQSNDDSSSSNHHHAHHAHPTPVRGGEYRFRAAQQPYANPQAAMGQFGTPFTDYRFSANANNNNPFAPSPYYQPTSSYNPYPSPYDVTVPEAGGANGYPQSNVLPARPPLGGGFGGMNSLAPMGAMSPTHHHHKHHKRSQDGDSEERFREHRGDDSDSDSDSDSYREDQEQAYEESQSESEAASYAAALARAQQAAMAQSGTPFNDYRFSAKRTGGSSYFKNPFTGHDVAYSTQARYGSPPEPPLPDLPPPPVAIPN